MTKEEIIEGNKLIDEFNEFYLKNLGFSDTELNYNTSWDCLMPVVEKINNLNSKYEINIYSLVVTLFSYSPGETKAKFDNSKFTKIIAVWLTVIEFIKWYNSCKKE